jgi:O-antigen ligase
MNRTLSTDLFRPSWAILQLALVLVMLVAANLSIAVSQLALGFSLLVLLWRRFGLKQAVPALGVGRWLLALAAWAALMVPLSTDPGQSLVFYKRFFLFSALWVTASVATDRRSLWLMLGAVALGAASISTYGTVLAWIKTGSLVVMRLGAMSNAMTSGCLLMISWLLGVGFLFTSRRREVWLWLGPPLLLTALGLALTMTRSAWLGAMVGLGLMLALHRFRLFLIFAGLGTLALLVLAQMPDNSEANRIQRKADPTRILEGYSGKQRVYMWREGWAIVKRHPVTGVGDRDLRAIGPDYYQHPDMNYFGHLHSNPVMLAAIWGVPGLVLGLGFLFLQLKLLLARWRQLREQAGHPLGGWVLGALGAWAGFFVAGLTEWYFGDAESMLLYLAVTGVALGAPLPDRSPGGGHV